MLPNRQERFLALLSNPKRRREFTGSLAHFKGLNPKFVRGLPKGIHSSSQIVALLKHYGAGTGCCVISEDRSLDGREMDLDEAIRKILGHGMGAIVSCVEGKLAYLEDEDMRCLLVR